MRTLRYLQSIGTIPTTLSLIRLSSSQVILPKEHRQRVLDKQPDKTILMCSVVNCVYCGAVDKDGLLDDLHGIYIFTDGAYYEGRLNKGRMVGKGKLTKIENNAVIYSYEGEWKDSKPDGYGE